MNRRLHKLPFHKFEKFVSYKATWRDHGRIDTKESELGGREDLQDRRKTIAEELEDLQTRIDRIETDAIEEFNENMDTVLSLLGYENIDRIWIERVQRDVREGRRKVTKNVFELHIVRSTDSDGVYEDSIDHLSESEREVTGLVFALAGYLVHDVHEAVPFMRVDSIGRSSRIGSHHLSTTSNSTPTTSSLRS